MQKPLVSLIGPAHRTHLWQGFYDRIITKLPFEVVFVSDKKPETTLPENFRWFYSTVKPAQCFEIAFREAKGDFIIWCGDDLTYTPYAIDEAVAIQSQYDYKTMVFFRFFEDGRECTKNQTTWDQKYNLIATGLISKQVINEAGGLADTRFVCGLWDCDLIMRIYALGGQSVYTKEGYCNEPHLEFHKKEANFATTWQWENEEFKRLWMDRTGGAYLSRLEPFQPYYDTDILIKSQGNKGKWS